MINADDTIAAISTAPGEAGIAIVRISGKETLALADKTFRGKGAPPSKRPGGTFLHGTICSSDHGADIDEVVLLVFRAPHSYTCEDVVEIQCHGGRESAKRILRAALDAGARTAEPGEFTRRAFLNGRIDLLQAEAVADLIQARSDRAAAAAVEQLEGRLSSSFNAIYDGLLSVTAEIEASLDFPDDELPQKNMSDLSDRTQQIITRCKALLDTWDEGRLLREGALVVIAGQPNVGKSTLFNTLLGADRAIVTPVPGTTRDTLEEQLVAGGIPLRLVDTAGLRDTECEVENHGVKRAEASIEKADFVILVMDASGQLEARDRSIMKSLTPSKCLILLNKVDLGRKLTAKDFPGFTTIECSLLQKNGVEKIIPALSQRLNEGGGSTPHAVISERHRNILTSAMTCLEKARILLASSDEANLVLSAGELRTSMEHLGSITGKIYSNELLDNIFRRFCVGK